MFTYGGTTTLFALATLTTVLAFVSDRSRGTLRFALVTALAADPMTVDLIAVANPFLFAGGALNEFPTLYVKLGHTRNNSDILYIWCISN